MTMINALLWTHNNIVHLGSDSIGEIRPLNVHDQQRTYSRQKCTGLKFCCILWCKAMQSFSTVFNLLRYVHKFDFRLVTNWTSDKQQDSDWDRRFWQDPCFLCSYVQSCSLQSTIVLGIAVSASAYYKNTSHLYRCTNTDLNMYVSMFFISSMFSSSSCRLDMRDSSLSLALLSRAFCLSASYCRWVLSRFTETVSATSTRAVINFIAISYNQINHVISSQIWCSHSGLIEDSSLLGCDTVPLAEWFLTY